MTDQLPRYRYWGDRKPNARLANIAVGTFTGSFLEGDDAAPQPAAPEDNPTVAVLRIYAPIDSWGGWWGINAEEVSVVLDALPDSVTTLIIRINSPGGEVPEALTILNMLRAHKAKTIAVVDGWAVSAGSVIACGCDETVMSPGTEAMVHDARIFAYGDPAGLRKMADRMDTTSNNIAAIYVDKAGGTEADWRAVMAPETWYTAKEFVEAGLADRVAVVPDAGPSATPGADDPEADTGGDAPENVFDLSMYRYAGRNHAPAPAALARPTNPPTASADGTTPPEGGTAVAFSDAQLTTMRASLELEETADEAAIVAAVQTVVAENLEERPEAPTNELKDGQIAVSKAEWEEMQGDAKRGATAAEKLHSMERKAALDAHRDKFLPANRKAWEEEYDRNPKATVEALKARPVVIPLDEIGHEVDTDTSGEAATLDEVRAQAAYKNWEI